MKKLIKTTAYIVLAASAIACAKVVTEGANDANIRYFNSWMKVNYPDLKPEGLGIYIIESQEGDGKDVVKEDGFVYVDYIKTDLEGNISEYTDKNTAKQLGVYDTAYYYGPKVMTTIEQTMPAGLAEAVIGMKVGGRKKVIIPSWLMSYYAYDTEQEYIDNTTGTSSAIYDITVRHFTDSIPAYEDQQIHDYMNANPLVFTDFIRPIENKDTAFYYQQLRKPEAEPKEWPKDTTIYINYTGKLLSGLVFDTTIERVAKDNGIYSSSKSYEPQKVKWGEKWSEIKLGESSVIPGFALTLWQMGPMEKGIGVFYSPLGYSYNGSGKSIPGYAPLIFEIEIVAKPE